MKYLLIIEAGQLLYANGQSEPISGVFSGTIRRNARAEAALLGGSAGNGEPRPIGGGVAVAPERVDPKGPPALDRDTTKFPGSFFKDINALNWAQVAAKWNMSGVDAAIALEKSLNAQGFSREQYL